MDPTAASEEEDNRKAKTVRGILECSLELARELLASCDGDVNKVIDIFKDAKMTQESTGTAGGISSVLKRKMPFGFASDSYEENLDKDSLEKTKFKKIREDLSNYLVEVRKSVSKSKEEAMMKLEDCPLCSAPQILKDKTVLQYSCAECGAVTCRRCMQQAHGDRECEDKDRVDMECGEKNEEFKKINVLPSRHFDVDSELEREFRIAEGNFLRMLRMRKSYEIKSIDIVYNEKLKKKFDQKKQEFKMMGLDDQPLLIFHGTPQENIEHILRENFDLSKVANGRRYGNGVYFSEVPEVSMKYTKDQSSLILCLVLQGNNSKEIKIPQTGVQAIGALAIVVPDVDQILPKYVINFADKPKDTEKPQPVLIPPGSLNLTTSSSASANTSNLASHLAYMAAGFPGPPVPAISAPPLSVPGFSAPPAPGFSAPPAPGFSAPPAPGFSAPPVPAPGFSIPPVPAPGFSAVSVQAHGFSAPPWPASGFSAPQVPAFSVTSVPSPGFSPSQVRGHGFSAPPISAPGISAPSFPTHGFSAPQVPGPGFSLQYVPFPGFSAPLVSANGFLASPVSAPAFPGPAFPVPASGPLPSQAVNSQSSIAAQTSQPAPAALYVGQAGYLPNPRDKYNSLQSTNRPLLPNPMPSLTMPSYNLVSQIVAQLSQAMSQISQTMSQMPTVPSMPQAMPGMQQTMPGMQQTMPGMQQTMPGMQQTMPGMQQTMPGMQPTVSQAVPGMQQISPQTVSLAMPGMQQQRGQVLQQQQSHVPGGQTAVIRQQLTQVHQNQAGVQRVVITTPGIRPGQPGSQITVPLATLQALKTGQGIPAGQPGHLLVKTETGQYQIVRVTPVTEPKSLPGQPSPSPAQATSSAASMAVPPLLIKSTKGKVGRPPKVRKNEKVNNKGDADACCTASGSVNLVNSQDLYCAVCNAKMSSKKLMEEHKKEREHRMKERSSK